MSAYIDPNPSTLHHHHHNLTSASVPELPSEYNLGGMGEEGGATPFSRYVRSRRREKLKQNIISDDAGDLVDKALMDYPETSLSFLTHQNLRAKFSAAGSMETDQKPSTAEFPPRFSVSPAEDQRDLKTASPSGTGGTGAFGNDPNEKMKYPAYHSKINELGGFSRRWIFHQRKPGTRGRSKSDSRSKSPDPSHRYYEEDEDYDHSVEGTPRQSSRRRPQEQVIVRVHNTALEFAQEMANLRYDASRPATKATSSSRIPFMTRTHTLTASANMPASHSRQSTPLSPNVSMADLDFNLSQNIHLGSPGYQDAAAFAESYDVLAAVQKRLSLMASSPHQHDLGASVTKGAQQGIIDERMQELMFKRYHGYSLPALSKSNSQTLNMELSADMSSLGGFGGWPSPGKTPAEQPKGKLLPNTSLHRKRMADLPVVSSTSKPPASSHSVSPPRIFKASVQDSRTKPAAEGQPISKLTKLRMNSHKSRGSSPLNSWTIREQDLESDPSMTTLQHAAKSPPKPSQAYYDRGTYTPESRP